MSSDHLHDQSVPVPKAFAETWRILEIHPGGQFHLSNPAKGPAPHDAFHAVRVRLTEGQLRELRAFLDYAL